MYKLGETERARRREEGRERGEEKEGGRGERGREGRGRERERLLILALTKAQTDKQCTEFQVMSSKTESTEKIILMRS